MHTANHHELTTCCVQSPVLMKATPGRQSPCPGAWDLVKELEVKCGRQYEELGREYGKERGQRLSGADVR